ncbi:hypothetical protein MC7420_3578 [Coleofasciculus chthonoplastes PCC 7420]|uniref:UDP-N-acetyl-alpha-D-muramoyl-L-alanyl-L-glutamate epimerase n=1 Tax=Coleofasciculus chthonoplastes PCC 7420 TaxID=118168 RepID=B4W068_9CYAN|nr:hypothetical protein [Coleofasciculus chthonoplastes]EDX72506.1 hypothetical protein MC7420_3578 [Coleofasciculus chthonoplastes PCC 7420]
MKRETIKVHQLTIHDHHLDIIYSADDFKFATKVFYHDLSFNILTRKYSQPLIARIAAYIALFEGMKLCSLFPNYYDISLIAKNLDKPVLDLFTTIYQGVFGQHWYENNITDYPGPEIIYPGLSLANSQPIPISGNNSTVLTGCGGGKDSIVALKLLQEADIPFASMQYSHTVYGKADIQHHLISGVLEHVTPIKKHKISIYDDFLDYPLLELYFPDTSGITVPETPVSIFEALPLMLNHGYNDLALAHEKSANTGNLFWDKLGKEVNHQWGKGYEAEKELNQFIQANLLSNFTYFSILQPIYDFRIFKNLTKYPEVLPKIHSCNIQKPWCKKCPKCAYVWLGLMAAFEPASVDAVFGSNLFDDDDLLPIFREMVGLGEHTPFECIGEIDESRLAMKKCLEKGLSGKAIEMFKTDVLVDHSINWQQIEQKYDNVYDTEHAIPDWIFSKIRGHL